MPSHAPPLALAAALPNRMFLCSFLISTSIFLRI